ncbi:unnamed protein product [Oikopleura dioica]|uniref:Uncharacterized protein n=1 Tax=Oikopleura dioica TaxID=34765 RepID=E4XNW9_OIKDI|nr:unnamed protein product [Oikopleura dioica]
MSTTSSGIFTDLHAKRAPPYTSEEAKQYRFNLYIDNICINIIQDTPEDCLSELTCCGILVTNALNRHGIEITDDTVVLFKMISCDALLKAILNKVPHEYIDFFASLNLLTNEVQTFSTASCLAGYLQTITEKIVPSGIIALGNNQNSIYRISGELAFIRIRGELHVTALKQWSENNPIFSPFWDVNIKRILAPSAINTEALTNWIASRLYIKRKGWDIKYAFAIHLASSSPGQRYPIPSGKVPILTKDAHLSKAELTQKINSPPTVRTTTIKPAELEVLNLANALLVSKFSNPALLHPLRVFALSKSKKVLDLALRLYRSKMADVQNFLTIKACKAHNGLMLSSSICMASSPDSNCSSRISEILNEASTLPLERSEHLYKNEIHRIVRDITPNGSLTTLLSRLVKSINGHNASPTWADLLVEITQLDKKDAAVVKNYCSEKGLAQSLSDLIETTLIHTAWCHNPQQDYDSHVGLIPKNKITALKTLNTEHEIVKGLIICFCSFITNNYSIDIDIAKLLPPDQKGDPNSTLVLLTDSDEDDRIAERASSTLMPRSVPQQEDLDFSPPSLSPINSPEQDSPPFWTKSTASED